MTYKFFFRTFLIIACQCLLLDSLCAQVSTKISNDQMTLECGYVPIDGTIKTAPSYCVNILLKNPRALQSTRTLIAPSFSVPLHAKVSFYIEGEASPQMERYGFFEISPSQYNQADVLAPKKSCYIHSDVHSYNVYPNVGCIVDGDRYSNEHSIYDTMPIFGDNANDLEIDRVPLIPYWDANKEGNVNLELEGSIGTYIYRRCNLQLFENKGWCWRRKESGPPIVLELPITIIDKENIAE